VINLGLNLAGQTVIFRFRMGSDEDIDNLVFSGADEEGDTTVPAPDSATAAVKTIRRAVPTF
jgi:hypothetical protein